MKLFSCASYQICSIHAQNEAESNEIITVCIPNTNTYIAENQAYTKEVFDSLLEQIRQGIATLHKEVDNYYSLKTIT